MAESARAFYDSGMSFECRYYRNGDCELLNRKCSPFQKGCVLIAAGARPVRPGENRPETPWEKNPERPAGQ